MSGEDKKLIEALEGYMLQPEPLCSIAKAAIKKIEDLEERIAIMEEGRIDLLKEQESIAPKLEQESMVCGVCGHDVIWQKMLGDNMWHDDYLNFCPNCGRAVKWG